MRLKPSEVFWSDKSPTARPRPPPHQHSPDLPGEPNGPARSRVCARPGARPGTGPSAAGPAPHRPQAPPHTHLRPPQHLGSGASPAAPPHPLAALDAPSSSPARGTAGGPGPGGQRGAPACRVGRPGEGRSGPTPPPHKGPGAPAAILKTFLRARQLASPPPPPSTHPRTPGEEASPSPRSRAGPGARPPRPRRRRPPAGSTPAPTAAATSSGTEPEPRAGPHTRPPGQRVARALGLAPPKRPLSHAPHLPPWRSPVLLPRPQLRPWGNHKLDAASGATPLPAPSASGLPGPRVLAPSPSREQDPGCRRDSPAAAAPYRSQSARLWAGSCG